MLSEENCKNLIKKVTEMCKENDFSEGYQNVAKEIHDVYREENGMLSSEDYQDLIKERDAIIDEHQEVINEKEEIIQTLNNTIDVLNTAQMQNDAKMQALQNAYNEVCHQRDVLFKVIDTFLLKGDK